MTNEEELAGRIVGEMLNKDEFSKLLGIRLVEVHPGNLKIELTVRADMVNGFGLTHGGVHYSLADTALALAASSHGRVAVAINNSIQYPQPVFVGDTLTAEATELSLGNSLALYEVKITNQNGELVASFRGQVFRTRKEFFPGQHFQTQ
jgi:acyl-CoA thioesterase